MSRRCLWRWWRLWFDHSGLEHAFDAFESGTAAA
jgi:hypothetical protein